MMVVSFNMAYRSFQGGSGRLDTRLDTPPSINRRHPNSCLALARAVFRTAPELIPGARRPPGFDIAYGISTLHQRFACARLSGSHLTGSCPPFAATLPSRPGEFRPEPLTDPDLTLSRHPARATERRLPPPVENWSSSCCQLAHSQRR